MQGNALNERRIGQPPLLFRGFRDQFSVKSKTSYPFPALQLQACHV